MKTSSSPFCGFAFLLTLVPLAACNAARQRTPLNPALVIPPSAVSAPPVSIGLIVDSSGSMLTGKSFGFGESKLEILQQALATFCDTLRPTDEAFLLTANGERSGKFFDFTLSPKLRQSFTNSPMVLKQALYDLKPLGATMLYDAILEGLRLVNQGQNRRKALLIISDGLDTASTASEGQVIAAVEVAKIPIYTIGLGASSTAGGLWDNLTTRDPVNTEVLQTLSQRTQGLYLLLNTSTTTDKTAALVQDLESVSKELRK